EQGGTIVLQAHDINLVGGSRLHTGLTAGGSDASVVSGNISLNATGDITLSDESLILNEVATNALGNGGDIEIATHNLSLLNASQIRAETDSTGAAGNINIVASELIKLDGASGPNDRDISAIFNNPGVSANGSGGNITIETNNLQLTDRGRLSVEVLGAGNGGNIDVTARGNVNIQSSAAGGSIFDAEIARNATGTGGNITIRTTDLNVRDGAQITLETLGAGDGGDLLIQASGDVNVIGTNPGNNGSRIDAETDRRATGNGGNVTIETTNLLIADGSRITLEAEGVGNGGDLVVRARGDISIVGTSARDIASRIDAESDRRATGNGGNVTLDATNLFIADGSRITTETEGAGNAGTLTIRALDAIEIRGSTPVGGFQSRLDAQVERADATGRGGDIILETGQLRLIDGGIISVETKGAGNAGNLDITARESIWVGGESGGSVSRISAEVDRQGTGHGGNLSITTNLLQIIDGGRISVETEGAGDAGSLRVSASDSIEISGINPVRGEASKLEAQVESTATGHGGNIFVETGHLQLSEGGRISIDTAGSGQGGNATIRANSIDLFSSFAGDTSTRLTAASRSDAPAGSFDIQTSQLSVRNNSLIEVSSAGLGGAGNLTIAADQISLNNNASLQALVVAGDQGNINITATDFVLLRNGSSVTTTATATASGGNINITSPFIIGLENSDIVANAVQGQGGNISLSTRGLLGLVFRDQLTTENDISASSEFGVNGTVEVDTITTQSDAGLTQLSKTPADPDNQVASACGREQGNQFIASGRGGLPISPSDQLNIAQPWQDFRYINLPDSAPSPAYPVENATSNTTARITEEEQITGAEHNVLVEAVSWHVSDNGQMELLPAEENVPIGHQLATCLTPTNQG
ncbi:MAG: S-layer family protein, partial [Cyanobacteria bacterium J06649_4]